MISLTVPPDRLRNRLPSAPVTRPMLTCSALISGVSQPACFATAYTMFMCSDCSEPMTYSSRLAFSSWIRYRIAAMSVVP